MEEWQEGLGTDEQLFKEKQCRQQCHHHQTQPRAALQNRNDSQK